MRAVSTCSGPFRAILVLAVTVLSACASTAPPRSVSDVFALPDPAPGNAQPLPRSVPKPEEPLPASTIDRARALLGVRYRYGGNSPDQGFDCSGFVRFVLGPERSEKLPRTAYAMSRSAGERIALDELSSGDLVFFRIGGRNVSHVGIYLGQREFIHAPSRGGEVRIDRLDDRYWQRRLALARRLPALPRPRSGRI
jgi:hypothetical protein